MSLSSLPFLGTIARNITDVMIFQVNYIDFILHRIGAEEDRLHEVALTAIKVANDPHLLPYPL